jgi:alkanesulfonate monooxygenase SsuD/methylene tetrahydromethanopterin reductase-like flavin-dependent oxidoreductase (luciferase family)
MLQTGESPFTGHTPGWPEIAATARHTEQAGFDSIVLGDHLLMRFDTANPVGIWECGSMIAAIAATTETIQIGWLTACTAYRNPALLAKMATTIDEISSGRFTLGLGAGWHEPEFIAFGYPLDHRVDRFEEALRIVTALLREGHAEFEGTYYQVRDCLNLPRGPRPGGIPIVMGAKQPRMLNLAATYADTWNRDFGPEPAIEDLPRWMERVNTACEAVGRDPATLERSAAVAVDLPSATAPRTDWNALTGSPARIAEALCAYADAGFCEVQLWVEPGTRAGIEEFSQVLELLDAG